MGDVEWVKTEVEAELRGLLRGVSMVSEIDLSPGGRPFTLARGNMERLLASRLPTNMISKRYPASTVIYLVGEGVYHYHHGGFWPQLELKGLVPGEMGPGFQQALTDLGLETFAWVKSEGAHRWIAPILLQGGIPRYCARDVLQLLLTELRQGTDDATEMISRWVSSPSRMFAIDRPAQRFLTHGGDLAVDLFQRLITMVNEAAADRTPDADELGIPAYLVAVFLALPPSVRRGQRGTSTLPSPRITFDYTAGHGPELVLPPIPRDRGARLWVVDDGYRQQRVPVSPHSEIITPLPAGTSWTVELFGGEELLRSTTFRGVAGTPVMLFDVATMTLLRSQERVTADDVVALLPHGFAFRNGDGSGEPVPLADAELPVLDGSWRWHEACHLDLTGVNTMWVGEASPTLGMPSAEAVVRVTGPSQRPHLGGDPCGGVTGVDGRAVYASAPLLVIPGGHRQGWDRWRLRMVVNGEMTSASLSDLQPDTDEIDLSRLLPSGQITSVDLDVIGPLGSDLRNVRFLVVPGISVSLPDRVLRPEEQIDVSLIGAPGVGFGVNRIAPCLVRLPAGEETVTIAAMTGGAETTLLVTAPRLMWALRSGLHGIRPLSTVRSVIGLDELGVDDALIVRARRRVKLTLELINGSGVLQELPWVETVGTEGRWVFSLERFRTTIRDEAMPRLRLQLRLDGHAVPVADIVTKYLTSALEVTAQFDDSDEAAQLLVRFNEERSFPGRELRLWSLDRPWEPVVSVSIPDAISSTDGLALSAVVAPGRYLAGVELADDWIAPVRPNRHAPSAAVVTLGDVGDYWRYLRGLDQHLPIVKFQRALVSPLTFDFSDQEAKELAPYAVATIHELVGEVGAQAASDPRFAMCSGILARPDVLAGGLAILLDSGGLETDEMLRLLIALLPDLMHLTPTGSASLGPHRLHRLHPLLGAILDPAVSGDSAAGARWAEHLGWDPSAPESPRGPAAGGEVSTFWLQLSLARLRAISMSLDLFDQQPLAMGGFIKAMLDWLISFTEETDGASSEWVERYRSMNDQSVNHRSQRHSVFLEAVKPKGIDFPTVARFPYDLLAAAINLVAYPTRRTKATEAVLAAAQLAPALTTRSLLVAIVLEREHTSP